MVADSPITQVAHPDDNLGNQHRSIHDDDEISEATPDSIPQSLKLDLRGTRVELDRETLMNLPESLLIVMFPNGLVLGRQERSDYEEDSQDSVGGEELNYVDFDPTCLAYVRHFYREAQEIRERQQGSEDDDSNDTDTMAQMQRFLPPQMPANFHQLAKIIVLREELEYYCLSRTPASKMAKLKQACGEQLRGESMIFDALQKNITRENNVAEQHLIDMLCGAGFGRQDRWGYRELEPMRTCIVSMSLVLLKASGSEDHMATAQKLLLFWRKPARKCWWDGDTVSVLNQEVRLWARRTWTLELALV